MPHVLEMFHLAQQDRVAHVKIGRGGIETGLDAQRAAELEPLRKILLANDLGEAFFQVRQLFGYGKHFHHCRLEVCGFLFSWLLF